MDRFDRVMSPGGVEYYECAARSGAKQKLHFTKMHGCANDYVYIELFTQKAEDLSDLAVQLSDRHTGIGGDGVIFICPSEIADGQMRMFNLDGSEGKMCGNGIRCVAKFLYDSGIARKNVLKIETLSGVKTCEVHAENGEAVSVTVDMGKAELSPEKIPVLLPGEKIVRQPLEVDGKTYEVTCVSMGNPHCVVFVDDPDALDLKTIGPKFERHPAFPERVNTEFVSVLGKNALKMRVWERGSGETMACGTGACASAAAACLNGIAEPGADVCVKLRGGTLTVRYTEETVFMTGDADTSFEGTVEI